MKYIKRTLSKVIKSDLKSSPVVTVTGPRQSGKSTLLKEILPTWKYVNLEEPSQLEFGLEDPAGFIKTYKEKVIIDEIQRAPLLLSQIQVEVDRKRLPGRYILSGSHNLLLLQSIGQTLAGRTLIRHLLPFSYKELVTGKVKVSSLEDALFLGGFPLVHNRKTDRRSWLDSYIETYVERDVRLIKNVSNLATFKKFLRLCAGRSSQLLDLSGLGADVGISYNTVREWVGVLEAGFIVYRVEPYYENYSKRVIKTSKIFFYDTGLLCRLLNIQSAQELINHPFRGAIFENWCMTEVLKKYLNYGIQPRMYFWRDQQMKVDLIVEKSSTEVETSEFKSGSTIHSSFIDNPLKLQKIFYNKEVSCNVVYGGEKTQIRTQGTFLDWRSFALN